MFWWCLPDVDAGVDADVDAGVVDANVVWISYGCGVDTAVNK